MKRTVASRSFNLPALALMAAVIFVPWGNPALGAVPAKGCPHCGAGNHGVSSGPCCPPEMPGQSRGSGSPGKRACCCAPGSPAFISLPVAVSPTWHVTTYLPTRVVVSSLLFPLNIFHPPELSSVAAV
ncbi:MAG: hypothetical protein ACOZF2_15915 [Thermodesulfobacteriota bacterium]